MAQITFDLSGKNGLAPNFNGDIDRTVATPELRYIGSDGQMADGVYNPFRRYGYMSPANATFANVSAEDPISVLKTSSIHDVINSDFYFSDEGQKLYKGDTLDDTGMDLAVDLTSTGTPVIQDLEIYQVSGTRKLFVIYEKSGYVEAAISSLPYNTSTDDLTWLSVTATNPLLNQTLTNRAFMRVADNGFAYLFMDNQVHKIDGTNSAIVANALLFPTHFQLTDAVDYRGYMFIAVKQDQSTNISDSSAVYQSNVGIYVWNRLTSISSNADFIPLIGVKTIKRIYIAPTGALRLMVINTERRTEIREYNGSTFVIIGDAGYQAYPNYHDSLTTNGKFTIWLGGDGYIYAHGKVFFNEDEGIFKIGQFASTSLPAGGGAILYGGANSGSSTTGFKNTKNGIYLSYGDSLGAKFFKTWDWLGTGADGTASLQLTGNVYTLVKFLPQLSTVKNAEIYCFPASGSGTTSAGNIKFYANQSSTAFLTHVVTREETAKGYIDISLDKPYVNSLQIEIEFSSNTTVGSVDFAPSIAVVNYEPTNTKG